MRRTMTCIECPRGCSLTVTVDGGAVVGVTGNECPKGERYAAAEVTDPRRILTMTVAASGLELPMIPVRTDRPIPKRQIAEAAARLRGMVIDRPVVAGECLVHDFMEPGVRVVVTRTAGAKTMPSVRPLSPGR